MSSLAITKKQPIVCTCTFKTICVKRTR